MTRVLVLAALLASPAPDLWAQAAAAPAPKAVPAATAGPAVVNLSLVEAIAAIELPQVTGLFAFIAEQDASFAFADLVARDPKAMKKYLNKLADDLKLANGLTDWDHQVCATLVNLYASSMGSMLGRPSEKQSKFINACVLAPVVPLSEIVTRRKR